MFNTPKPNGSKAERPIKLWYIGGFASETPKVTAKGKLYIVPEAGEYLTVPQFIANDLIRRNRNEKGQSVFTKDGNFAKAIMARRNAPPQEEVASELTREQLLAKLAALDAADKDETFAPAIPRKTKADKMAELSKEGEI